MSDTPRTPKTSKRRLASNRKDARVVRRSCGARECVNLEDLMLKMLERLISKAERGELSKEAEGRVLVKLLDLLFSKSQKGEGRVEVSFEAVNRALSGWVGLKETPPEHE